MMVKISADFQRVRISELGVANPTYREFIRSGDDVIVNDEHKYLPEGIEKQWIEVAKLILLGPQGPEGRENE